MASRFETPQYRMVLSMFDSFNNWLRPRHAIMFEIQDFYKHAASSLSGNTYTPEELLEAFYGSIESSELSIESRQLISNAGLTFLKYMTFNQDSYFWLELSRIYQESPRYPVNYYSEMPSEIEMIEEEEQSVVDFVTDDTSEDIAIASSENYVVGVDVASDTDTSVEVHWNENEGVNDSSSNEEYVSDVKHPSTMTVEELREYSRSHNLNLRGARLKNEILPLVEEHYNRFYL